MIEITDDIKNIIEQNLPSATAGVMSEFIKNANKTSKEFDKIALQLEKERIGSTELKNETLKLLAALKTHEDIAKRTEACDVREAALDVRERDINIELMRAEVDASNERVATVERLVDKVFGHPSVTVTNRKEQLTPVAGNKDCCGYIDRQEIGSTTTTVESSI